MALFEENLEDEMFNFPKSLVEAYRNSRLVIFVGAGVSMGAGAPSWSQLVGVALDEIEGDFPAAKSFRDILDKGAMDPLAVLDQLKAHRADVFNAMYKRLAEVSGRDSEVHRLIGDISKKIITTNFDKLFEENLKGIRKCVSSNKFSMQALKGDDFVFKLHGCMEEMDKCAIFTSEYEEIYSEDSMAISELRRLISENVFLYVGFSMRDPFYKYIIERHRKVYGDYASKAFMVTESSNSVDGVEVINIGGYEAINNFFKELKGSAIAGAEAGEACESEAGVGSNAGGNQKKVVAQGIDVPPTVDKWVGRAGEIDALSKDFRVFYLTGMGGQGKSALAARYMTESSRDFERVYWKDFKEEGHNFRSKVVDLICDLNESVVADDLVGFSDDSLIDEFFAVLGQRRCLFVFDNVDSYIDIQEFVLQKGVGRLANLAENRGHKSKFIFTCRPMVNKASASLLQIKLSGLLLEDIRGLLEQYSVTGFNSSEKDEISELILRITKGHPLWVSFIIVQAGRGKRHFSEFVDGLESRDALIGGGEAVLSASLLAPIWDTLNDHQKRILSFLAECPEAQSIQRFEKMVSQVMNYQKMASSLKILRNLNLIVYKEKDSFIELHPLVREFVTGHYPHEKRKEVVGLIIGFYKGIVHSLKSGISSRMPLRDFENWINKAQLEINSGNRLGAFCDIVDVLDAMMSAGYSEDVVRMLRNFLSSIDWSSPVDLGFKGFDEHFRSMLACLSEYGDYEFVFDVIGRYEFEVTLKDERYLNAISMRIYNFWLMGDFAAAINLSDKAEFILGKLSSVDKYDLKHRMALARRDSREKVQLDRVRSYFLAGLSDEDIASRTIPNVASHGPIYGNAGRYFFFVGDTDAALLCYAKSFLLLHKSSDGDRLINIGYACLWLFEALSAVDRVEAVCFFAYCICMWKKVAPALANRELEKNRVVASLDDYKRISEFDELDLERLCEAEVNKILFDV